MVRFIGRLSLLGKGPRPGNWPFPTLERADRGHPLDELKRASLLRGGVDALRQHELDLLGEVAEPEHEAELPLPAGPAHLVGQRSERAGILDINLHAGMPRFGGLVERSEALNPYLGAHAIGLRFDVDQDGSAALEQRARCGKS